MNGKTANIIGVIGASGTGKGQYVRSLVRADPERFTLVWSPLEGKQDDYAGVLRGVRVHSIPAMAAAIKAGKRAIVLVPGSAEIPPMFDRFCRIAAACPGARIIVEELSRVTRASWAPPAWSNLSTAGRHDGQQLIGTAQRPTMIDKNFLGNCTEVRGYRMVFPEDAKNVASLMREPADAFLDLPDLHYIHRHLRDRVTTRGVQHIDGQPAPKLQRQTAISPQSAKKVPSKRAGKAR